MTIERTAVGYHPPNLASALPESPVYEPAADIMRIVGVVRRQYKLALVGAAAGVLLALALLLVLSPSYKSTIRILLDQDRSRLLNEISGEQAPASAEEYIATQIAVMTSDIVARRVIHALGLSYDPDDRRLRIEPASGEAGRGPRPTRVTSDSLAAEDIDPGLVAAVQRAISVYQVEKSFVVEITANDPDPQITQKLAAAYGNAYLTDQLSARFEATRNAGSWLEDRINSLRQQSLDANAAVEKFRADNDLVSSDGRLLSDLQLGGLNDQLATARLAATQASAKVEAFRAAVEENDVEGIIGIVGSTNELAETAPIRSLRSDYIEVTQRARDVTGRWGPDNAQAKILQSEVIRQADLVLEEGRRILESFRSDLRTAERQVESITAGLTSAAGQSKADNSTLVALRSLEQRSAAYNGLYQDYLARYQEAVQQQTLSLTTGRLISKAELPSVPVFPNKKVIVAILLLLGGGIGGGIGVGRELLDRTFRSREHVERLGLDFLGYVAGNDTRGDPRDFFRRSKDQPVTTDSETFPLAGELERAGTTLDTIHTGIEIRRRAASRIVALVSVAPNRGRSVLALALAAREAENGRRVLLVDGDHTESRLSRSLAPEDAATLADVVSGKLALVAATVPLANDLQFLPLVTDTSPGDRAISIPAELLKVWGMEFDLVVIDLPPAGPISEARALAQAVDSFVCVVRWGETPLGSVPMLMKSSPTIESKLIGVVIDDVNMRRQQLYDAQVSRPEPAPRG